MKQKINIAELLKDCPKGMELDCTMYEGAELDCVTNDKKYPVKITIKDDIDGDIAISLTKNGGYSTLHNAKCVIFPKGKTTWKGFVPPCQFKDGDIVSTTSGNYIFIIKDVFPKKETYYEGITHFAFCNYDNQILKNNITWSFNRFATEEEKQKLFKVIKENGYKWNVETKTLEKLVEPKFKVGDKIKRKKDYRSGVVTDISDDGYKVEYQGGGISLVSFMNFAYQNDWELAPKFKIGDKVRHKDDNTVITITGIKDDYYFMQFYNINRCDYQNERFSFKDQDKYELVPNKFDITTLKPFDSKVLVRHNKDNKWCASFFSHIDNAFHSHCYKFVTVAGKSYPYCIPYEGNEHLHNTTNPCSDYYLI